MGDPGNLFFSGTSVEDRLRFSTKIQRSLRFFKIFLPSHSWLDKKTRAPIFDRCPGGCFCRAIHGSAKNTRIGGNSGKKKNCMRSQRNCKQFPWDKRVFLFGVSRKNRRGTRSAIGPPGPPKIACDFRGTRINCTQFSRAQSRLDFTRVFLRAIYGSGKKARRRHAPANPFGPPGSLKIACDFRGTGGQK